MQSGAKRYTVRGSGRELLTTDDWDAVLALVESRAKAVVGRHSAVDDIVTAPSPLVSITTSSAHSNSWSDSASSAGSLRRIRSRSRGSHPGVPGLLRGAVSSVSAQTAARTSSIASSGNRA